jgi:heat shock protein HslJ
MKPLAYVLCMLMGLAGCSSGSPRAPVADDKEAAVTAADERTLRGSSWRLADLGGTGVLDGAEATLTFPEAGRIAGNGSCNNFSGRAAIGAGTIRIGPLASTKRACPPAVMDQEAKYLRAMEAAQLIAMQGPFLLVYARGMEEPLRFTRQSSGG